MNRIIGIVFMLTWFSGQAWAQEKLEKERKIKTSEVPAPALAFLDSFRVASKVKWYREEGLHSQSIEAKFIHNKARYSLEFDTLGRIEDIEIEMNWQQLPPNLQEAIKVKLQRACSRFRVTKVQEQFTGTNAAMLTLNNRTSRSQKLTTKFELMVRCTDQGKVNLFEYLFNAQGDVESVSKIVFRNSSHLEY